MDTAYVVIIILIILIIIYFIYQQNNQQPQVTVKEGMCATDGVRRDVRKGGRPTGLKNGVIPRNVKPRYSEDHADALVDNLIGQMQGDGNYRQWGPNRSGDDLAESNSNLPGSLGSFKPEDTMASDYAPFRSINKEQLKYNKMEHPYDEDTYDPRNFSFKKKQWKMKTFDDLRDNFNSKKLLPQEVEDDWFDVIPHDSTRLIDGTHWIDPSIAIGVSTVQSSLRNASHDIRGDVPNPKIQVSPWNNSTIAEDNNLYGLDRQCWTGPSDDFASNLNSESIVSA